MAVLSISEVAESAGLRPSALRYYERQKLVQPAGRRGGMRVYDAQILQRLGFIRLAQAAGFSIAEIRTLLHGFSRRTPPATRWQKLAEAKRQELDQKIRHVQAMKRVLNRLLRCPCPTMDDCGVRLAQPRATQSRP